MILCGCKEKNTIKRAPSTRQINVFTITASITTDTVTIAAGAKIIIKLLLKHYLLHMFENSLAELSNC